MAKQEQESVDLDNKTLDRLLAHRQEFLRFIEKRVDSLTTAEDILQSAFVKGFEKRSTIRDEERVIAWFYRLLRNAVIDHYRSQDSRNRVFQEWPERLDVPDTNAESVKNEICYCVSHILEELKPEYSEALRIVDIGEGRIDDLAKQDGISTNNAAVRVHRAREALRKQVKSTCGTCAEHRCVDCYCKR